MVYKTQQYPWQSGLSKKELYWQYFIMSESSNTQAIQLNIYKIYYWIKCLRMKWIMRLFG